MTQGYVIVYATAHNVTSHVKTRLMWACVICRNRVLNYLRVKIFLCNLIFWYQIIPKSISFKHKTNFKLKSFYKTF